MLPDESIVFGGDLFETRMFPIVPYFPPDDSDVDGDLWVDVLGGSIDLAPATVVPGHGEVTDVGLVEEVRDYLVSLRDETAALKRDGLSADEAVEELRRRYANGTATGTTRSGSTSGSAASTTGRITGRPRAASGLAAGRVKRRWRADDRSRA